MTRFRLSLVVVLTVISLQSTAANTPFNRGVNLTNWFQVGSAQQIQFSKYTRQDFENIKSLGADVVRLPINLHFMTSGEPDYILDPLFLSFLDEVIGWTEELDLHLILDNHTFDSSTDTDPKVGEILLKVWPQMALHYLNTSTNIYYEVLNEPHGISDELWNTTQQMVVNAIRKFDTKHTIIVGPASWNSYNNLSKMPIYNDDNLIYTFHFYDPFLFTHQGAGWTDMTDLSDVPFPYDENKMPEFPNSLNGTWIQNSFNDYKNTGTIDAVHKLLDIAINFANDRNVPIYCGEFGVYDVNSPDADRTYWYGVIREYLELNKIAWTVWDYHGGFGIYKKDGNGMFLHDLNVPVCEALGFSAPEQTPFVVRPDSVGFEIFSDYAGQNINNTSYANGELSFYSNYKPNNGDYCIQWSGATQYQAIVFNFTPDKDLSQLVENGFALDLLIRGTDPNGSLDIRFLDSKTSDDDHPWRNRIVVDNKLLNWDGEWEHLHIPLSEFKEHGAWDNAWFNPEGLFDWTQTDKLEITTEAKAMSNDGIFWIDNIFITDQDTAQVKDFTGIENINNKNEEFVRINFINHQLEFTNQLRSTVHYKIYDISGRIIMKESLENNVLINSTELKKGWYIVVFTDLKNQTFSKKIPIY